MYVHYTKHTIHTILKIVLYSTDCSLHLLVTTLWSSEASRASSQVLWEPLEEELLVEVDEPLVDTLACGPDETLAGVPLETLAEEPLETLAMGDSVAALVAGWGAGV